MGDNDVSELCWGDSRTSVGGIAESNSKRLDDQRHSGSGGDSVEVGGNGNYAGRSWSNWGEYGGSNVNGLCHVCTTKVKHVKSLMQGTQVGGASSAKRTASTLRTPATYLQRPSPNKYSMAVPRPTLRTLVPFQFQAQMGLMTPQKAAKRLSAPDTAAGTSGDGQTKAQMGLMAQQKAAKRLSAPDTAAGTSGDGQTKAQMGLMAPQKAAKRLSATEAAVGTCGDGQKKPMALVTAAAGAPRMATNGDGHVWRILPPNMTYYNARPVVITRPLYEKPPLIVGNYGMRAYAMSGGGCIVTFDVGKSADGSPNLMPIPSSLVKNEVDNYLRFLEKKGVSTYMIPTPTNDQEWVLLRKMKVARDVTMNFLPRMMQGTTNITPTFLQRSGLLAALLAEPMPTLREYQDLMAAINDAPEPARTLTLLVLQSLDCDNLPQIAKRNIINAAFYSVTSTMFPLRNDLPEFTFDEPPEGMVDASDFPPFLPRRPCTRP